MEELSRFNQRVFTDGRERGPARLATGYPLGRRQGRGIDGLGRRGGGATPRSRNLEMDPLSQIPHVTEPLPAELLQIIAETAAETSDSLFGVWVRQGRLLGQILQVLNVLFMPRP